tara:strand:+ start:257 stop:979 length:723 start_codon:yes stop_codon:yes gene_type:complete
MKQKHTNKKKFVAIKKMPKSSIVRVTKNLLHFVSFDSAKIYKVDTKKNATHVQREDVDTNFTQNNKIYKCESVNANWTCKLTSSDYLLEEIMKPFTKAFKDEVSLMMFGGLQGDILNCDEHIVCFVDEMCIAGSKKVPDIDDFFTNSATVMKHDTKTVAVCNIVDNTAYLLINALCVSSMYRRRGIGSILMKRIVDKYQKDIIINIFLDETQAQKRAFYTKLNFKFLTYGNNTEVWIYKK